MAWSPSLCPRPWKGIFLCVYVRKSTLIWEIIAAWPSLIGGQRPCLRKKFWIEIFPVPVELETPLEPALWKVLSFHVEMRCPLAWILTIEVIQEQTDFLASNWCWLEEKWLVDNETRGACELTRTSLPRSNHCFVRLHPTHASLRLCEPLIY